MDDIHVDRLKLTLAGLAASDAERLAQTVAERLASGLALAPGSADVGTLQTTLSARHGETIERTAARVVDAIRRGLER